jgi:hypothetical protein
MMEANKCAWYLSGLVFFLFVLLSSGTTGSGDAMVRYQVARSLVARGTLALEGPLQSAAPGRDGDYYAIYGIGQPLLFALPEFCLRAACQLVGGECDSDLWRDVSVGAACVLVFPLISAVGIGFLYLLLQELGFSLPVAAGTALLIAVGSSFLPYAKFHQEENQIAALTFMSAYFAVKFWDRQQVRDGIIAAMICWLPMWFRVSALAESLPLAGFLAVSAFQTNNQKALRPVVAALVGMGVITAAWLLFYNWYRYGSITDTGYLAIYQERGDLQGSVVAGLVGPWVHPSKSLFIYSPLILLAIIGARWAFQDKVGRALVVTSALILILSIIIPAKLKPWGGDTSWGPRYQIAGQMLFLTTAAFCLNRWPSFSGPARKALTLVIGWAVAVQFLGVLFSYNLEYNLGLRHTSVQTVSDWFTREPQIPMRVESLVKFSDVWLKSPTAPKSAIEEYSIPAFLPWKLGQNFGPTVWPLAVAVWVFGWVVWVKLCRQFIKQFVLNMAAPHASIKG